MCSSPGPPSFKLLGDEDAIGDNLVHFSKKTKISSWWCHACVVFKA